MPAPVVNTSPPFVTTNELNAAPFVPTVKLPFTYKLPLLATVTTLLTAAPTPIVRPAPLVQYEPVPTTVTLLFEAPNPIVLAPALIKIPPLVAVKLLKLAPFVPTMNPLANKSAPLARVTLLLTATPAPTTKPSLFVHTEFVPVKNTAWLLQPFPTINGVVAPSAVTTVPLLTVSEFVPMAYAFAKVRMLLLSVNHTLPAKLLEPWRMRFQLPIFVSAPVPVILLASTTAPKPGPSNVVSVERPMALLTMNIPPPC